MEDKVFGGFVTLCSKYRIFYMIVVTLGLLFGGFFWLLSRPVRMFSDDASEWVATPFYTTLEIMMWLNIAISFDQENKENNNDTSQA